MTPDQWFWNPITGMRMRMTLLPHQTQGRSFIAEYSYTAWRGEYAFPAHVHPNTTETFEILSGKGRCQIGKEETEVSAGQSIVLPKNVPHIHPWSDSDVPIVARQTAICEPPDEAGLVAALQAAITIFGLANAGKVNAKGRPNLLHLAVLAHGTIPQTYLGGVPFVVQRIGTGFLGAIGRLFGARFAYPEYGVVTPAGIELAQPLPQPK